MAAIILDAVSASSAGSYHSTFPISAGSNRIAVVGIVHAHGSDAAPPSGVTLGGQAMTLLTDCDDVSWDVTASVYYLLEAGIAAMSGSALSVSGGTYTTGCIRSVTMSCQDAEQSAPAFAQQAINAISGALSLARVADSVTFAIQAHDSTLDYTAGANPANSGTAILGSVGAIAYGAEADTARTADRTWSAGQTRDDALIVLNISPAATGPSVSSITNPASDSMTITLSEAAATVDTISITYGGVTQSQSYTTGDDTTFTIASLTRNLLPPTGTTTVTLLAGATEITSTTTVLDDIAGWETTDLVSPVTTEGSVFYNHTGATPVTGDKVRHNDPGNTTISATGILTQTTPRTVTVEAWDDSDETYGTVGICVWGVAKFANERWVAYLTTYKDVLATFGVDINTQVYRHLGSLGYTGLMPERLKQAKDDGVI